MIDKNIWTKAWALLDVREKRNAWIVLAILILAAVSAAMMIGSVMPFLAVLADPQKIQNMPELSNVYETLGFENEYNFVVALGFFSLALVLFSYSLQILKTWALARFSMMRVCSISSRLLTVYLSQPYEYFLNNHSGEMSTKILSESKEVVERFIRPAFEVIAAVLTITSVVMLLLWVNPIISIICFFALGAIFSGIFLLSKRILVRSGQILVEENQERFRLINEAIGGVKDIKLRGNEAAYVSKYNARAHSMSRANLIIMIMIQIPSYIIQTLGICGIVIICLVLLNPDSFAANTALGEILPLVGLFAFAGQRLLPEISKLYSSVAMLSAGAASVDKIYHDLHQQTEAILPQVSPPPLRYKNEFQLDKVSYNYPNSDQASLKNLSISFHPGEKIGIVGVTGAGKTTLVDLILGLLSPSEGILKVDGVQITPDNIRNWHQTVGYVPQDIFLTDASLAENIALGLTLDEINYERLLNAAKIAQIHDFVEIELSDGYETIIGERGIRLSGGQRQRIGIARALYNESDLLVFDEATSALDNLTENELMEAIDALSESKTILMIAHRLSTVKNCDRIIVMDKGLVIGCDNWDTLMRENTAFQNMAKSVEVAS